MVQVNSFLDRGHAGNGSVMHSQGNGSDCPWTPLGVSHIHVHHADLTLRPQRRTAHPSTQGCPFVATLSRLAMSHLIPVIAMLISILKYHGWKQAMWVWSWLFYSARCPSRPHQMLLLHGLERVTQAGPKLMSLLPQPPQCWDCR